MKLGRRFLTFWFLLLVACISGCCGCGNCCPSDNTQSNNSGSCNSSDSCSIDVTPSVCDPTDCATVSVLHGHAECLASNGFGGGETCQGVCNAGFMHCSGEVFDCDTNTANDPQNCGNCGVSCNGASCTNGVCDVDASTVEAIVTGLDHASALTTDGVEIFFVDDGVLSRADVDGASPSAIASGVGVVGNIETDGTYVYWGGTWTNESGDAGDADAGDADAGGFVSQAGFFRVLAIGGDVEQIADVDALPTLLSDGFSLYGRAQTGDAGASSLGVVSADGDAGFLPFATLAGNTGNMHAFAVGADQIVALDDVAIVSVPLDGGAKTFLELSDASDNALFSTTGGIIDVASGDASFTVHAVGSPSAGIASGSAVVSAIGAHNGVVVVADGVTGVLYRYLAASLEVPAVSIATSPSSSIDFVAIDDTYAYWTTGNAIYRAPLP